MVTLADAPQPQNLVPTLVVGYSNDLRGDDGAGPHTAGRLAAQPWPQVVTLIRPQLTPDLAADLAAVERAIFVDAYPAAPHDTVRVEAIAPPSGPSSFSHHSHPGDLLGLTQALYGHRPAAWWVLIPGQRFDLGEGLSPQTAQGVEQALAQIAHLIREGRPCTN